MIGSFHDRYGPDILYILGLVLSTISCPLLAMGRESVTQSSPGLELTLLAFIGVSFVLLLTPAMAEVSSFGKKKAETHPGEFGESGATAQCCGLLNMSLAIGGVLGPLLAGFIRSAGGWYLTNLVLGAWPQIWLVVTLMRFGWKLRKGRAKKQLLNA
jgi:MFS family permease